MREDTTIEQRSTQETTTKSLSKDNELGKPHYMPGGKLGYREFIPDSEAEHASKKWREKLNGEIWGFPELSDPDFVEGFISKIPDEEEQLKYVENSSKFFLGSGEAYDPNYVLVFRRTLPSDEAKPEQHWTNEYATARKGLRNEIPAEHRLYSVIMCSTLANILVDSGYSKEPNLAQSDGEIKVDTPTYDQKRSLLIFRPKDQQEELEKYQKLKHAIDLETILQRQRDVKGVSKQS